ncbi:MAG: hypothetical protein IPK19_26635 [Chloroflexi bacterium]|nr:hypothetical protein [Chloroflexota bacterium]
MPRIDVDVFGLEAGDGRANDDVVLVAGRIDGQRIGVEARPSSSSPVEPRAHQGAHPVHHPIHRLIHLIEGIIKVPSHEDMDLLRVIDLFLYLHPRF